MWSVLVAAIANMVLGSLWFGPVFGKLWRRLGNMSMPVMDATVKKQMMKSYSLLAVGSLIMAYVLAVVIALHNSYFYASGVISGIAVGALVWIGFVLPVTVGVVLWERKSWKYWAVTYFFYLVSFMVMGAILAVMMLPYGTGTGAAYGV